MGLPLVLTLGTTLRDSLLVLTLGSKTHGLSLGPLLRSWHGKGMSGLRYVTWEGTLCPFFTKLKAQDFLVVKWPTLGAQ